MGNKGRSAAAVLADAEPLREYLKDMAGLGEDLEDGAGCVTQVGLWPSTALYVRL